MEPRRKMEPQPARDDYEFCTSWHLHLFLNGIWQRKHSYVQKDYSLCVIELEYPYQRGPRHRGLTNKDKERFLFELDNAGFRKPNMRLTSSVSYSLWFQRPDNFNDAYAKLYDVAESIPFIELEQYETIPEFFKRKFKGAKQLCKPAVGKDSKELGSK